MKANSQKQRCFALRYWEIFDIDTILNHSHSPNLDWIEWAYLVMVGEYLQLYNKIVD